MNAAGVMLAAFAVGLLGRWANNKKITAATVVRAVFALIVVAALDSGRTQPIAKGFSYLFLAAVLLSDSSPINALQKIK